MNKFILLISLMLIDTLAFSDIKILKADFRHRPPEMIVQPRNQSGPLKDIIEEASKKIGYKIKWREARFSRSLSGLRTGLIDIVPRTIKNKVREEFVHYLGPIGYQQKDILFMVRKGEEGLLNDFIDLYELEIGIKRHTAYFDEFDNNQKIRKAKSSDDRSMAKKFSKGKFKAMIILDKGSIEKSLKEIGFTDYAYANYKHVQRVGNYYGFSKRSPHAHIYPKLNETLSKMTKSGRVAEIYKQFNATPPIQ